MSEAPIVAGISDHAGWAVVVCVAVPRVLDTWRAELIDPGLPALPHHHEAQKLPVQEAIALIHRVRASARAHAAAALEALPASTRVVSIRKRPVLPATVAERISDYWAQCRADSVMYRSVIAEAAADRGWAVHEYDAKTVLSDAKELLGIDDIMAYMKTLGREHGPPWNKDHRLATAGAIVAGYALPS